MKWASISVAPPVSTATAAMRSQSCWTKCGFGRGGIGARRAGVKSQFTAVTEMTPRRVQATRSSASGIASAPIPSAGITTTPIVIAISVKP